MKTSLIASTFLLAASSLHGATVISILESGFEGAPGRGGGKLLEPWKKGTTGTSLINIESYASIGTSSDPIPGGGTYLLYFNTTTDSIYQVLTETLAASTTYTLSIQAIDRTNQTFRTCELRFGYVSGTDTGVGGDSIANSFYGENLLTATTVVNPTPVNAPNPSTSNGTTNLLDGWQDWTYTFTTGASPAGLGSALRVEIVQTAGTTQSLFDNISLTKAAVIPEPTAKRCLAAWVFSLSSVAGGTEIGPTTTGLPLGRFRTRKRPYSG